MRKPAPSAPKQSKALDDMEAEIKRRAAERKAAMQPEDHPDHPDYFKRKIEKAKEKAVATKTNIQNATEAKLMTSYGNYEPMHDFADQMTKETPPNGVVHRERHSHFSKMAFWANSALNHGGSEEELHARVRAGMETDRHKVMPVTDDHIKKALAHMRAARTDHVLGKSKVNEIFGWGKKSEPLATEKTRYYLMGYRDHKKGNPKKAPKTAYHPKLQDHYNQGYEDSEYDAHQQELLKAQTRNNK